jgi:hypothetical protein
MQLINRGICAKQDPQEGSMHQSEMKKILTTHMQP